MEQVKERFEEIPKKMKDMEEFIALHLRRHNITVQVRQTYEELAEIRKMMDIAHELLHNEYEHIDAAYEAAMQRLRQKQTQVINYVLKERQRKVKEAQEESTKIQAVLNSAVKSQRTPAKIPGSSKKGHLTQRMENLQLHTVTATPTPKISLQNYKESPLVKRCVRLNPIPFIFLEFETEITQQQFESIPKYMRGRETLEEFTNFVETVIVPCFNDKYKLLHRQRSAVRHADLEMWKMYNDQVTYVPDRYFITAGDISRKIQKMLDKKIQTRLTMLRHIGVLQEKRVSQTACYIWNA